ncbi:MAG: ATP-binding cassette domain-containing protein [Breznakibacter sp.]
MGYLQANEVVKQYANHLALNKVSIDVPPQSVFGLLGPNGAGKTTLIRIINQITAPDSGQILIDGRPLRPEDVSIIGYLPEERGLYKKMKVGEQALYLAQLKGMSRHDALKTLKFWFEKFEIQPWWDKKVEELSKGMQQKVQFVTTVLHKPSLLIFDEPFSGFDPINAQLLKEEIIELRRQGATIVFSTHNMSSVEELCDSITLINKSQAILSGQVDDVRRRFKQNLVEMEVENAQRAADECTRLGGTVLKQTETQSKANLEVKLPSGVSINDLLKQLLPVTEIHGIREILPSMNDVFIQVVKQSNN